VCIVISVCSLVFAVKSKGQIRFRRAICEVVEDEVLGGVVVKVLIIICVMVEAIFCAAWDLFVMLHLLPYLFVRECDVALLCKAVKGA